MCITNHSYLPMNLLIMQFSNIKVWKQFCVDQTHTDVRCVKATGICVELGICVGLGTCTCMSQYRYIMIGEDLKEQREKIT